MTDTARKVELAKKNWRIELWTDYRLTDEQFDEFMDAVTNLAFDKRWPYDVHVCGVKKEISR